MLTRLQSTALVLRAELDRRSVLMAAGGWVIAAFIVGQILRLGTSIGLAALLAPELLGLMALINTVQTGGELLSDIGIGQSIVQHKDGDKSRFYRTAWTLQVVRGLVLFAAMVAASVPIAHLYDEPLLLSLLPVSALVFVISGFISPARFLLQRDIRTRRLAIFGIVQGTFSAAVHLFLAWYLQSIWALVYALLISASFVAISSFFMMDWRIHRFTWDRGAVRAIFGFGKWVFLSTLIFFLAANFDRLYVAQAASFAALGVYGIARTFADTATALTQHLASQVLFPKVATSPLRGVALREAVRPVRRAIVVIIAVGMACGLAVADRFITLAYDARYAAAGFYLSVLLTGGWFAMLATFADNMLMGIGKPANMAIGNGAKLLALVTLVPLVLPLYGMAAAVVVFSAVEMLRYAVLTARAGAHGLSFWRQDAEATALFVGLALVLRELTGLAGLTSGVAGWVDLTHSALPFV
ncbi:oligosaccharide flippase family protein [Qipengyuania thermophila]|uniref:oligosaccharide flippase family protein n=1 Tax=Qipengyuania thermophila TaxID=2509361 RepID=UPI0013EB84B3|nr:oligosaccharide flippase family protein [Qipengyuania thermophila]